jgi:penicillin-binding protein 1C
MKVAFVRTGLRALRALSSATIRVRAAQTFWCTAVAALLAASAWLTVAALDLRYPPPLVAARQVSPVVVDRSGDLLRAFTIDDGRWRLPVRLADVDPNFVAMLIAYEDKRFYRHSGIDPLAMTRAAWQLVHNGRIVSGGSTLSMQLARLLEPRGERSFAAKAKQILRALQIERRLSKREILESYLTLAPYGGNLEGIHAAALAYFGKPPRKLTVDEAALLIALPQLPEARRPDRKPEAATQARNRVLTRMVGAGIIPQLDAEMAAARAVPRARQELPALAAHLSERLRATEPERSYYQVALDRAFQSGLETLARQRIERLGPKLSVAILVADAATGEVRARVGSPDYFSQTREGAVDMTLAVRSPGSTLKPFIYALAFDAGLARPESLIEDAPADFNGYAPVNFDRSFQGTVTVREALQLSLNIPAVAMLEAVGPLRLMSLFKKAGTAPHLPRDRTPSLAIGLGGVGMTLEDLVTLYTVFPGLGQARGLGDTPRTGADTPDDLPQLLSPQATWYVNTILAGTPPPDHAAAAGLAFKTGTSYGYRDAWAIGYDGRHVMGVWVGRPDGASVPGLTGRTVAAPLLFEGFRRIGADRVDLPPAPDDAVVVRTADLPPGLRHVGRATRLVAAGTQTRSAPTISYPPDGARVEQPASATSAPRPVVLKVRGGAAPFNWFANGAPVITRDRRRQTTWTPDGTGFSTLTVIDAEGRSDKVTIFLK